MSAIATDQRSAVQPKAAVWKSRSFIFVVGVFVLPSVLGLAFNSWGPLTSASAIAMAFATVAGHTIAVVSAVTVVFLSFARRSGGASVAMSLVIAAFVVLFALSNVSLAGDLLQQRLELVSSVDELNR